MSLPTKTVPGPQLVGANFPEDEDWDEVESEPQRVDLRRVDPMRVQQGNVHLNWALVYPAA